MNNTTQTRLDTKIRPHLGQYAPVWLRTENTTENSIIELKATFQHREYGWISRKYQYDTFNNVLYYRGQITLTEGNILATQEQEPYITTDSIDTNNSYGG
jgi:hypothetical protein